MNILRDIVDLIRKPSLEAVLTREKEDTARNITAEVKILLYSKHMLAFQNEYYAYLAHIEHQRKLGNPLPESTTSETPDDDDKGSNGGGTPPEGHPLMAIIRKIIPPEHIH